MIKISGTLVLEREPGEGTTAPTTAVTEDEAAEFMKQVARDAVQGTFGEFPAFWNDKLERSPDELVDPDANVREADGPGFDFDLRLSADLFPIVPAGLQHLIGVLAGDLFYLKVPGFKNPQVEVSDVELPEAMRNMAFDAFRDRRAHDIAIVRNAFQLGDMPMLAFSFKPRVGIKFDEIEAVTLGVLQSGFHLVELDTRNLLLDESRVERLLKLAEDASNVGGTSRVTRFSPNLSVPAHLVTGFVERFMEIQPDPVVVKVDGGLDGISSCQAIRSMFSRDEVERGGGSTKARTPIITCYPLLREKLRDLVPADFYVRALAMSGVDIIYPGGRPSLGRGGRTLSTEEKGSLVRSVNRYHRIVRSGWPMPTVAGGVYAGELHAFYELSGPEVAFFLGGGVALHKDGPIEGAKLCVQVVKEAVELRGTTSDHESVQDLPQRLRGKIEAAYDRSRLPENVLFNYVSPSNLLADTLPLRTWFSAASG